MGSATATLPGAVRYEALIAVRQRLLWVVLAPMAALIALVAVSSPAAGDADSASAGVAVTALGLSAFYTMGVGVALSDCLARHRAGGDLLEATPTAPTVRLLGAVGGPLAVALVPAGAVLLLVGTIRALVDASPDPIGAAAVALLTIVAPGALALTALAVVLGLWLPVVFARIAVVLTWGWATLLTPGLLPVPTVTGTILSPLGGYPAVTWLGAPSTWADRGETGPLRLAADDGAALLNLGATLLIGLALLALARLLLSEAGSRIRKEDQTR